MLQRSEYSTQKQLRIILQSEEIYETGNHSR